MSEAVRQADEEPVKELHGQVGEREKCAVDNEQQGAWKKKVS